MHKTKKRHTKRKQRHYKRSYTRKYKSLFKAPENKKNTPILDSLVSSEGNIIPGLRNYLKNNKKKQVYN
jgi:hypothetical protein